MRAIQIRQRQRQRARSIAFEMSGTVVAITEVRPNPETPKRMFRTHASKSRKRAEFAIRRPADRKHRDLNDISS